MDDEYREPRRGNRAVKLIVFVALLVALTAGGVFAWKYLAGGPTKTDTVTKSYDEPVSLLVVEGDSGEVDVVAGDGDGVTVEAKLGWSGKDKPRAEQNVSGETLTVKAAGCDSFVFGFNRCEVNLTIEVPEDVDVDAYVDSGDLSVSGVEGNQKLTCDSGNITVDGSGERLTVSADSGDVTGRDLAATNVTADVDSGNVDLAFTVAPEKVKAKADSGDVTLSVPKDGKPYDVNVSVDSGDTNVDVATASDSPHKIDGNVDSGDLTVDYT